MRNPPGEWAIDFPCLFFASTNPPAHSNRLRLIRLWGFVFHRPNDIENHPSIRLAAFDDVELRVPLGLDRKENPSLLKLHIG